MKFQVFFWIVAEIIIHVHHEIFDLHNEGQIP
jgi:hypothetical protein